MKKYLYAVLFGCAITLSFSACGGSSTSGTTASGSSSNELVGNLPSLVADLQALKVTHEEEIKKCTNMDEAMKLSKKQEEEKAAIKKQIIAVGEKLGGKPIPYKVSEGLFYTLSSAPMIQGIDEAMAGKAAIIEITFTAAQKEALTIPRLGAMEYRICYKYVDSKGAPIQAGILFPIEQNTQPVTLAAGQAYGKEFKISISISKNPQKWADFAEIVFITPEEYGTVEGQLNQAS